MTRGLKAWFDINNDGEINIENETINDEVIKNLIWTFPDSNSMILLINGDDTIALVCHDCKKVYGFSDVNYKDEKYREI